MTGGRDPLPFSAQLEHVVLENEEMLKISE